jgi:hypothetical protein
MESKKASHACPAHRWVRPYQEPAQGLAVCQDSGEQSGRAPRLPAKRRARM